MMPVGRVDGACADDTDRLIARYSTRHSPEDVKLRLRRAHRLRSPPAQPHGGPCNPLAEVRPHVRGPEPGECVLGVANGVDLCGVRRSSAVNGRHERVVGRPVRGHGSRKRAAKRGLPPSRIAADIPVPIKDPRPGRTTVLVGPRGPGRETTEPRWRLEA